MISMDNAILHFHNNNSEHDAQNNEQAKIVKQEGTDKFKLFLRKSLAEQ